MTEKKRSSFLLPIFLIVVVDVLGLTIVLPLLPFYAERFGATPFVVGLLVTTFAACQLVSGPVLGQISDRTGRRPLLILSQVGTLAGFLVLAWSNALWMVFVSRVIDGLTAGNLSLAQAYISDVTEPQNRAKSFAIIGIAFGIGFLFGPALSGFLSQYGYQYPVYAAAALSFTSILCTYFLLPRVTPHEDHEPSPGGRRLGVLDWSSYSRFFNQPGLGGLLAQIFLFFFSFSLYTSGFALFAERRFTTSDGHPFGPKEVGYVFAYAGFLGILLQGGLIGRLVKRFGERVLIAAGFAAAAIGYLAVGFIHVVPLLLVTTIFSSFGNGVLRPALSSLISQAVSRREQGTVMGLSQSLNSVAQILAPMLGGFLIDREWLGPWAWTAMLVALSGLVLNRWQRARRHEAPGNQGLHAAARAGTQPSGAP